MSVRVFGPELGCSQCSERVRSEVQGQLTADSEGLYAIPFRRTH